MAKKERKHDLPAKRCAEAHNEDPNYTFCSRQVKFQIDSQFRRNLPVLE